MRTTLLIIGVFGHCALSIVDAFALGSNRIRTAHEISIVQSDQDVIDVASFRNGLMTPSMMVAKQEEKREAKDPKREALNGLFVGLGAVGPLLSGFTYLATNSLEDSLKLYFVYGILFGLILALGNLSGRNVYIPTEAEATNRIIVDYAEGLQRKADVGFVARSKDETYQNVSGIMAVADVQLRNSKDSPQFAISMQNLPPHLHLKNMDVHQGMRRKGVASALIEAIAEYGKTETDAELITLDVEEKNEAAVKLYENAGFEFEKSPKFVMGRKFMTRRL